MQYTRQPITPTTKALWTLCRSMVHVGKEAVAGRMGVCRGPHYSGDQRALGLLGRGNIRPRIILCLRAPTSTTALHSLLGVLKVGDTHRLVHRGRSLCGRLGLTSDSLDRRTLVRTVISGPGLVRHPVIITGNGTQVNHPPRRMLRVINWSILRH